MMMMMKKKAASGDITINSNRSTAQRLAIQNPTTNSPYLFMEHTEK